MRTAAVLMSVLLLGGANSACEKKVENGLVRTYHSNGKVLSEITYRGGKKHGPFMIWYDNGLLNSSAYFENDSIVGSALTYYEDGVRKSKDEWSKKHKLHGISMNWYENGMLADSGRYKNNRFDGEWKSFYKTGKLKNLRFYEGGQVNGQYIHFGINGDTLRVELYSNGNLVDSEDF